MTLFASASPPEYLPPHLRRRNVAKLLFEKIAAAVLPSSPRPLVPFIIFEDPPPFAAPPPRDPAPPAAPPISSGSPSPSSAPSPLLSPPPAVRAPVAPRVKLPPAARSFVQNSQQVAIPVFVVPRPTFTGRAPTDQKNPQSAIPVYFVVQPSGPPYPNDQGMAGGAVPVYLAPNLGTGRGTDPTNAENAIPVWDAGGPPTPDARGRFPTDQRNPNAAIPVYIR